VVTVWQFLGRLPAPVRHVLLLVLAAVMAAVTDGLAQGKAPREILYGAWLAVLAVVTPLIQSYGAGKQKDQ
jgi:hypothetical protein